MDASAHLNGRFRIIIPVVVEDGAARLEVDRLPVQGQQPTRSSRASSYSPATGATISPNSCPTVRGVSWWRQTLAITYSLLVNVYVADLEVVRIDDRARSRRALLRWVDREPGRLRVRGIIVRQGSYSSAAFSRKMRRSSSSSFGGNSPQFGGTLGQTDRSEARSSRGAIVEGSDRRGVRTPTA